MWDWQSVLPCQHKVDGWSEPARVLRTLRLRLATLRERQAFPCLSLVARAFDLWSVTQTILLSALCPLLRLSHGLIAALYRQLSSCRRRCVFAEKKRLSQWPKLIGDLGMQLRFVDCNCAAVREWLFFFGPMAVERRRDRCRYRTV